MKWKELTELLPASGFNSMRCIGHSLVGSMVDVAYKTRMKYSPIVHIPDENCVLPLSNTGRDQNLSYAARGLLGPSPHRAFPVHCALNVTKAFLLPPQSSLRSTIGVATEWRRDICWYR